MEEEKRSDLNDSSQLGTHYAGLPSAGATHVGGFVAEPSEIEEDAKVQD